MVRHHNDGAVCSLCEEKLLGVHPYPQGWFRQKKAKYINLHISNAFRNEADQERAYIDRKSKLRWPNSAHNHMEDKEPCSLALDLFQIDEDGVARFSVQFFAQINQENVDERIPMFWGGRWKTLGDYDHFEYREPQGSV